jgi:two-component system sensor histidine kinase/response regulator
LVTTTQGGAEAPPILLAMAAAAITPQLQSVLAELKATWRQVTGVEDIIQAIAHHPPPLILVAPTWAGGDGYHLCAQLPADQVPLLLWGRSEEALDLERWVASGGQDYCHDQLPAPLLRQRLQQYWQRQVGRATPEQRLQAVVDQTAVGINEADLATGRFVLVNQAFCDLLGYTREELLQLTFQAVTHAEDTVHNAEPIRRLYQGEVTSIQLEKRYRSKQGELIWTQVSLSLVRNLQGVPIADLAVVVDIRDRKRAEAERDARQQFLQQVLDAVPSAVCVQDPQGRLTVANQAMSRLYHCSPLALLGQGQAPPAPMPWQQADTAVHRRVMETGETVTTELYMPGSDPADSRWYQATVVPLRGQGDEIRGTIGNCVDITRHRKAEMQLRRSLFREEALTRIVRQIQAGLAMETLFRNTVEELRAVLECDRVAIYRFDADWSGEFVAESVGAGWPALLAVLGPPVTQASDGSRCYVQPWESVTRVTLADTCLQEEQGCRYQFAHQYSCVENVAIADLDPCYRDLLDDWRVQSYLTVPIFCGPRLWGLLGAYHNQAPQPWPHPEIAVVVQTATHLGFAVQKLELIQQLRQRAIDLKQAKETADAANRSKGYFLANISHELRTPLNIILGMTQVLQQETGLTPQLRESLGTIFHSGQHLLTLINDVLDLNRLEAGRMPLNVGLMDLATLVSTLDSMLRQRAQEQRLDLMFTIDAGLPSSIHTDGGKLRQVLLNLLNNALKYTHSGQVRLHISGKELGDRQWELICRVSDTGPGIAPCHHSRIFEAFEQGASQPGQGGAGLGLAICKHYAELLSGHLTLESEMGVGSTFTLRIPVVANATVPMLPRVAEVAISTTLPAIRPPDLAVMPRDWLQRCHTHALRCDDVALIALIKEIPREAIAIRQCLETYLKNFDFLTLSQLIAPLLPDAED